LISKLKIKLEGKKASTMTLHTTNVDNLDINDLKQSISNAFWETFSKEFFISKLVGNDFGFMSNKLYESE